MAHQIDALNDLPGRGKWRIAGHSRSSDPAGTEGRGVLNPGALGLDASDAIGLARLRWRGGFAEAGPLTPVAEKASLGLASWRTNAAGG